MEDCARFQVFWSTNKVLIIRMKVGDVTLQVFGVEPNGDVHIPWAIGAQKGNFRAFAERIAASVPGACHYETPKTWSVKKHGEKPKKLLSISEMLDASTSVRAALEQLNKTLMNATAGN